MQTTMGNIRTRPVRVQLLAPMFKDLDLGSFEVTYNGTVKQYIMPMTLEELKLRIRRYGHFLGTTDNPNVVAIALKSGQEYIVNVSGDNLIINL